MASCCVAYKCHNSKIGQKFQVHLFLAHQEMKKLPKYGKIKYCQHKSHKFAFEESSFNKSVSLRKRFMKSKDKFMFKFAPVFLIYVLAFSMLLRLLSEVVNDLFYQQKLDRS